MKDISLLDLLKSGAHFGHKTSRWNPRMKSFLYTVRNDVHIFDLEKTRAALLKAANFAAETVQAGGTVLFVGTKRQARPYVQKHAQAAGMPYVDVRWLGGTFTNFKTIQKTIRKMEKLMDLKAKGELESRYTKKERLLIERELETMTKLFTGIKDMRRLPQAVFIMDVNHDEIALVESLKSKIPVIAIVDSNSNPDGIAYPIPANDDAAQALDLIAGVIADAVNEGRGKQVIAATTTVNAEAGAQA